MKRTFKEEQKFTQWWLWVLLTGIGLFMLNGVSKQLIWGQPFGSNPMSDLLLLLFFGFMVLFISFFWMLKLTTEIDADSIKVTFFPLVNKKFLWSEIESVQIVSYGFVGGWGIRIGTKHGTVYNTRGNKGLAIKLNNGKKYCIGTQKEEELRTFLKEIGK